MASLAGTRIFAGFVALMAITQLRVENYVSVLLLLSVSHSLLAAYYSKVKIKNILGSGMVTFPFLSFFILISLSSLFMYQDGSAIYFLVLGHHVVNEVFISIDPQKKRNTWVIASLLAFESMVFFACTPKETGLYLKAIPIQVIGPLLTLCLGVALAAIQFGTQGKERKINFVFVIAGFAAALFSVFIKPLNLDFIILYHFTFWLIFPALKTWHRKRSLDKNYGFQTLILMLVTLPFTVFFPGPLSLSLDQMSYVTRLFAYFHIVTSLALSTTNPDWIVQLFTTKNKLPTETI